MTDISNTDDTIDIRDVIERVEELREQRVPRYVAGWNMPGYMPDNDPAEFDDADEAREYLIYALDEEADNAETEAADDPVTGASQDEVNAAGEPFRDASMRLLRCNAEGSAAEYGETVGRFHYWISYEGMQGLDEDETAELAMLESLLSDLKGYGGDHQWEGDWYPVTLIRESYFTDYAEELAEDMHGKAIAAAVWPFDCIDWEQAARNLQQDYSECEFNGVTYYYR